MHDVLSCVCLLDPYFNINFDLVSFWDKNIFLRAAFWLIPHQWENNWNGICSCFIDASVFLFRFPQLLEFDKELSVFKERLHEQEIGFPPRYGAITCITQWFVWCIYVYSTEIYPCRATQVMWLFIQLIDSLWMYGKPWTLTKNWN